MDEKEIPENLQIDDVCLIPSLPSEIDCHGEELFKYQGWWYDSKMVQAILNFQRGFEPQDTDIMIASYPNSGTTWLKALTVALLERSKHSSGDHPLLHDNPHPLVPFFERDLYTKSSKPDMAKFSSSPRLFSTHVPLHTLREGLKNSPCKILYVWRNVKDVLVSYWYFKSANLKIEAKRSTLESMFESFCTRVRFYGPFWEHVLAYWKGSLEDSKNVLFLRYEDLKTEPRVQLKIIAEFLDCPFTAEEEEGGSVEDILDICSLLNLKNLEESITRTFSVKEKSVTTRIILLLKWRREWT